MASYFPFNIDQLYPRQSEKPGKKPLDEHPKLEGE